MKEKVFKFRIVELTHKYLDDDNETIDTYTTYKLYRKVSWIINFSGWQEVCDGMLDEFASIEDAKDVANHYVNTWKREYMETKRCKDLQTETRIVLEFDLSPWMK